ncbi:hypothetical protein EJB05_54717, partial [Eragrostis curvula]
MLKPPCTDDSPRQHVRATASESLGEERDRCAGAAEKELEPLKIKVIHKRTPREGILPSNNSSAIVAVVGEKQYYLHRDITLEKLKEIMLPNAVDYFCQNADATVYQMIWQSEHGSAFIQFEKASINTRRTCGGARKRKLLQGLEQGLSGTHIISRFLDLWGAHMPIRLRSFFVDWMQKEKEGQFTADHVIWKMIDKGSRKE